MIKSLYLKNFQAHVSSEFAFKEDVSVIVGLNDANKSAVTRALGILLFNDPFKEEYIHYGKKSAVIEVVFTDGRKIRREKSKSKNTATWTNADGTESIFPKISKLGEKLEQFSGFRLVKLDGVKPENIQIVEAGDSLSIIHGVSYATIKQKLSTILATTAFELAKKSFARKLDSFKTDLKYTTADYEKEVEIQTYLESDYVQFTMQDAQDLYAQYLHQQEIFSKNYSLLQSLKASEKAVKKYKDLIEEVSEVIKQIEEKKEASKLYTTIQQLKMQITKVDGIKLSLESLLSDEVTLTKKIKSVESELNKLRCDTCGKLVKCYD